MRIFDLIKLLIDNFREQIDINLKAEGRTVMHWICSGENVNFDMAKLLIDNFKEPIDINVADDEGETALDDDLSL